jgi:hypothetical protein
LNMDAKNDVIELEMVFKNDILSGFICVIRKFQKLYHKSFNQKFVNVNVKNVKIITFFCLSNVFHNNNLI